MLTYFGSVLFKGLTNVTYKTFFSGIMVALASCKSLPSLSCECPCLKEIMGSLSCPLHSEIRYYIFGSDRDMGFNPRKKNALSISMTFGIQGESLCLCLCFEYYSPVLTLASLELLSLKTTLLSWH